MTKATVLRARPRAGLTVRVDRQPQCEPPLLAAQLVDCSRREIQVGVPTPLKKGELIRVRLRDESSGLQLDVAGGVASCREEETLGWLVHCRFDHELDWETLGELFLCGILESAPV